MHTLDSSRLSIKDLRNEVLGIDIPVPLIDGSTSNFVFLDNAASTPTLRRVQKTIDEFLPWYSGVHHGTGLKSIVTTETYEEARSIIGEFVGADTGTNSVILVKNTTEAINKLANRLGLTPDDIIVTTVMEHHSNDLPWRKYARVIHVGAKEDGHLDLEEMQQTLKTFKNKVKLVAVTGASNITGICNPIYTIARWAHDAGARIFVDAAQLAPHRPITMRPDADPEHIDFLAFSGHKIYAPFGTGVLIGPRAFFEQGDPDMVGGSVVDTVTLYGVRWNSPPEKEEAGGPNVVGAVALARAILTLSEVGMENIASHEYHLMQYAYDKLKTLPGLELYGPTKDFTDNVGLISFNIEGMNHALVASIFGTEGGIGLRSGCFSAQPYMRHLLHIKPELDTSLEENPGDRDWSNTIGMVRASFGCYNNEEDVDRFINTLARIIRNEYVGKYIADRLTGEYRPEGVPKVIPSKYFSLRGTTTLNLGEVVSITA